MIISYSGKKSSGKDLSGAITQALIDKPGTFDKMDTVTEEDVMYKVWDVPTFKNIKFADKLKDIICLLLGCTREKLEDREYKETPLPEEWWCWKAYDNNSLFPYTGQNMDIKYWELVKTTPRLLLQLMGTECGRQILHPNLWVNAVMSNYKTGGARVKTTGKVEWKDYPNWVITDMRFPNELKAVKDKNGITIRVNRSKPCGDVAFDGTEEEWEELVASNKAANESMNHPSETALDNAVFDYTIENDGSIKDLIKKIKEILIKEKII